MSNYKALQNKALRQGVRVFYFILEGKVYTSNGHVMVADKISLEQFKPLVSQYDLRELEPTTILNEEFINQFKQLRPLTESIQLHYEPVNSLTCVSADGKYYQEVYVEYVMAKYDVDEWKIGGNSLVAVNDRGDMIAAISPVALPVTVQVEEESTTEDIKVSESKVDEGDKNDVE